MAKTNGKGSTAKLRQGAHRHRGARRDHRRRPAAGPADARLRQRGLRQDAAGDGVPGARRDRVRRAGRLHGLRGDRRGADRRTSARSASTSTSWPSRRSCCVDHVARRAQRDRGDRRIRPRGAVHPPRLRDRLDRRQARRARHDRDALRRLLEPGDPARRAAAAVPLAQGQGRHRGHHRASAATGRSPARASRSTSPTA